MQLTKNNLPFLHYFVENFLPENVLENAKELSSELRPSRTNAGHRGDIENRLHLSEKDEKHRFLGSFLNHSLRELTEKLLQQNKSGKIKQLRTADLRAEICCDGPDFWQVPHLDTQDKIVTILCYLGSDNDNNLGTDIFANEQAYHSTAPFGTNKGLIFFPDSNTWHGFRKNKCDFSFRRTLIVNFVVNWGARHELYTIK